MPYDPVAIATYLASNQDDAASLQHILEKDDTVTPQELRDMAEKAADAFKPLDNRERYQLVLAILRAYLEILLERAMEPAR